MACREYKQIDFAGRVRYHTPLGTDFLSSCFTAKRRGYQHPTSNNLTSISKDLEEMIPTLSSRHRHSFLLEYLSQLLLNLFSFWSRGCGILCDLPGMQQVPGTALYTVMLYHTWIEFEQQNKTGNPIAKSTRERMAIC